MAARPRLSVSEVVKALEIIDGPALPDRQFEPLDELISCIVSQHSNDSRTYPAFAELRRRYPTWKSLIAAPAEDIEEVLRPAGLAREKTRRMRAALGAIYKRVGAFSIDGLKTMSDSDATAWLRSLPGIGPKTAAVTLAFAFGRDVVAVDTHVLRVSKRLGWIPANATEAEAHDLLARKVPKGLALRTHIALIRHGRSRCHPHRPDCGSCPLVERCPWALKHQIGYHLTTSATKKPTSKRMSQPLSAPISSFDSARKQRCFAEWPFGGAVVRQVDRAELSGPLWPSLESSPDAAGRIASLWLHAVALLPDILSSADLAKSLLTGVAWDEPPPDATATPAAVADWARKRVHAAMIDAVALSGDPDPGKRLSDTYDELVSAAVRRLSLSLRPVVVGDWATQSLGGQAPLRLLCFGHSATVVEETTMLKSWFDGLRRHGLNSFEVEPVAWTWGAFEKYELEHMPMRERYDLVSVRSVTGDSEFESAVRRVGFALPLTPERLRELVAVRRRQETETMRPSHLWRHLSLGYGSLADLQWIVQIHELRFPTATQAGSVVEMPARVRALARAQLINAVERDELLEAWRHLRAVRFRLAWLGLTPEILPENPAKLARLALAFGYEDANVFLAYHQRVVQIVRGLVDESRERLRG